MAVLPDDIKDIHTEDRSTRTIFNYIKYMKEQLEFWASNLQRGIASINEDIADIPHETDQKIHEALEMVNIAIKAADCLNIANPSAIQASLLRSGRTYELRLVNYVVPAAAGTGWTPIFKLPVMPTYTHQFVILGGTTIALGRISNTGTFDIYSPVANAQYYGGCTFIV